MKKNCFNCKQEFPKKYKESKPYFKRKKYCSYECFWSCPIRRQAHSVQMSGRKLSEEHKEKLRAKLKLSCSWLGKKMPLELRKKLSEAHRGKPSPKKGKKYQPLSEEHKQKIREAHKKSGLRPPCLLGEMSSNWKGGRTPIQKLIRTSREYKIWRASVFERDNYTCQICGIMGKIINANHIKKFSDYPEIRLELTNGITLCKNCHFTLVNRHELEWESYFQFNLEARNLIDKVIIWER